MVLLFKMLLQLEDEYIQLYDETILEYKITLKTTDLKHVVDPIDKWIQGNCIV